MILGDFKIFTSKEVIKAIKEKPRESRKEIWLKQFEEASNKKSNVKN